MNAPMIRATGGTGSETYLASLAEKTFLNLWSNDNGFKFGGDTAALICLDSEKT